MSIQSDFLMGIIGLPSYFGMKKVKITAAMLAEMVRIEKTTRQRAKDWVAMRKPARFVQGELTNADYHNVIAALESPYQANPDISGLPIELQAEVVTKYVDIRGWLEDHRPALQLSQGIIAREIEPPESAKSKFMWSCGMIDNVRRIFDLLDSGALSLPEALAFKELFPELALFVATEYLRAAVEFMYNEKKPTLSGWQLVGMSALMGTPTTSFEDVAMWQSGFEEPAAGPAPRNSDVKFAASNLTDIQKVDAQP